MDTLCNRLTVNSVEEIIELLLKEKLNRQQKKEIEKLLIRMKKEMDRLSTDLDVLDTYFHEIQSVVCVD